MKKTVYGIKLCMLSVFVMCGILMLYTLIFNATTDVRVKSGSESSKIMLVQEKLKELGIYDGDCTGVYDVETAEAVRRFQEYNKLYANGVCDSETLQAMGLSIYSYSDYELDVLAKVIEAEAGNTDLQTMTAVGAVVLNRIKTDGFPDSVVQAVYSGGSFDCIVYGTINDAVPSEMAYRAAEDAMMGFDPTNGALYVLHGGSMGRIVTLNSGDIYFAK